MTHLARLTRPLAVILVAVSVLGSAPAFTTAPPDDPRSVRLKERIAGLKPYVQLPSCRERPDEARWTQAGAPDAGRKAPLISAHRGGNTLAPENTLDAYEAAFAYGVDFVEVDVRETKDGHFVANHDATVDRTTDGTGDIANLTLSEVRALNAADYSPWRGSAYDPSRIATLDEILALAKRVGAGLELDIKIGEPAHGRIAALVAAYGLTDKSIFNSSSVNVLKAAPGARLIYNRDSWEDPALLFDVAHVAPVFGSKLAEYTPQAVAAIHDACGVVLPHAYDQGAAREREQFLAARAIGADGVQTNQPALIVAAAGVRVDSQLKVEQINGRPTSVCLVNRHNEMGFLGKPLTIASEGRTVSTLTTAQHGCAVLSGGELSTLGRFDVRFEGDPAVAAARISVNPK